jgi:hypothetical protein
MPADANATLAAEACPEVARTRGDRAAAPGAPGTTVFVLIPACHRAYSGTEMPTRTLTQNDVRRLALALPEAEEGAHMGHPDLRVRNKIFASLPAKPGTVAMKIRPENLDVLVRSDPETFSDVWGGRWLGVKLGRVSERMLKDLLKEAWELTAPRTLVAAGRNVKPVATAPRRRKRS